MRSSRIRASPFSSLRSRVLLRQSKKGGQPSLVVEWRREMRRGGSCDRSGFKQGHDMSSVRRTGMSNVTELYAECSPVQACPTLPGIIAEYHSPITCATDRKYGRRNSEIGGGNVPWGSVGGRLAEKGGVWLGLKRRKAPGRNCPTVIIDGYLVILASMMAMECDTRQLRRSNHMKSHATPFPPQDPTCVLAIGNASP